MEEKSTSLFEIEPQAQEQTVDFIVRDDFVDRLPEILSNVEQIREWAVQQTERDRNLLLQTNEDFTAARKRCAEINRVIDRISEKRIEVKKAYNAPYNEFEKSLKGVTAVLSEAKDHLWGQIKAAEAKQQDEKLDRIRKVYDESATDMQKEYRPLESIFNPKWLNRSVSMESIRQEIVLNGETVKREVRAIRALRGTGDVAPLLLRYKDGATVTEIIDYNARLTSEAAKTAKIATEKTREQKDTEEEKEMVFAVDLRVIATKEQFAELKEWLFHKKIKYGRVPKEENNNGN